jgi:hypothetical protein
LIIFYDVLSMGLLQNYLPSEMPRMNSKDYERNWIITGE